MTGYASAGRLLFWKGADRLTPFPGLDPQDLELKESLTHIAKLAAHVCGTSIALVAFNNEHNRWFKASFSQKEILSPSLESSLCRQALLQSSRLVVPNMVEDFRFKNCSFVVGDPYLRFYASIPLVVNGAAVGILCIVDHQARPQGLTTQQTEMFAALAKSALEQIRLKQSNRKLTSEQKKYKSIVETLPQMLWLTRPDGSGEYYNKHWTSFTGLGLGFPGNESWIEAIHPEDRDRALTAWNEALERASEFEVEYRLQHQSSTYRWVLSHAVPIFDDYGRVEHWLGTSTDIHVLKKVEQDLRNSESRLRTLVDIMPLTLMSPQAVWFNDPKGAFTYCNKFWSDYTGMSAEKAHGQGWIEAISPEHRESILASLKKALFECRPYEMEIPFRRASDGTYRWFIVRGQPLKNEKGDTDQWFGVAFDIHERKSSEEALRASEERLQLALKAARMVAWDLNPRTNKTRSSVYATDLGSLGSNPSSYLFRQVHPHDQSKVDSFIQNIELNGTDIAEYRCVLPSGEVRWLRSCGEKAGIDRIVGVTFDITADKETEREIWRSANHDLLTGLPNRRLFQVRLEEALAEARKNQTSVNLLLIDMDDFKDLNDTMGHDAGDALLKETAARLQAMARSCDTVARLGGDEFAVLIVEPLTLQHATRLGSLIADNLRQPFTYQKRTILNRVSIGIASFPDHDHDPTELMKDADIALYQAKNQGRSRVLQYSPEMRSITEKRVAIGHDIREAIANSQIIPFYQPKINLSTGEIVGFEALARWQHPKKGLLTPAVFDTAFEDHELAIGIGNLMLSKIAEDVRSWLDQDIEFGHIALNLSHAELGQPDFVDNMLRIFEWRKIPPHRFEVEVTETVLLGRKANTVSALLQDLQKHGVKIALDDFGTGYASLTHLKQFPIDHVKIDRSFVSDVEHDLGDKAIIDAIISLGKSLNFQVTAEGVETLGQAQQLRELGCNNAQGYLYAKPLASSEVPGLVQDWKARLIVSSKESQSRDS